MKVYDEGGRQVDATFGVSPITPISVDLFFESGGPDRNTEYAAGLELILRRAGRLGATIDSLEVASSDAYRKYSSPERSIDPKGYPLPLVLGGVEDFNRLRARISTAQSQAAKQPGSRGGNPNRRIRARLSFSGPVPEDLDVQLGGLGGRRYWAFLGDPRRYDVEGAIRDLVTDVWATDDKPVSRGDKAVLWKSLGGESRRGIVALADVVSDPERIADSANPYWRGDDPLAAERMRVEVKYLTAPGLPIWLTDHAPGWLGELSVARARGGSVFYLTPAEWNLIVTACGRGVRSADGEDEVESAARALRIGRSQGTGLDPASRRAVELRAMAVARAYYCLKWPTIFDVSAHAPYDFHLRAGDAELRVEVKGTTGLGEQVVLTHREVEAARANYPDTALFVVSRIELDRSGEIPVALGGDMLEIRPWMPDREHLTAISLRYEVPR